MDAFNTTIEPIRVRVSVRDFVEFVTRSGDLDNRSIGRDAEAMAEGARMHRRIQKAQPAGYRAEVALQHEEMVNYEGRDFALTIEGRADGIYEDAEYGHTIDEIKCMLRDVNTLSAPVTAHLAQARCYAYMEALGKGLSAISIRMTYVHLDTETIRFFYETFAFDELAEWFLSLCREYCRFAKWEQDHREARDASVSNLPFPFPYRPGQKELVTGVYRTISQSRRLFIEAPTGVGKTVSALYPAVLSMSRHLTEKIFYLTAKTIARTVAEECCDTLVSSGAALFSITLTAKEKLCVLDEPKCNPAACPRAEGHFDRVNDAILALLTRSGHGEGLAIKRETLLACAEEYRVCPYELSLDLALFADIVICDYNYVFDPTAYLRRFFTEGIKKDYVFLIDEAHNLVERSREMYSAELTKEDLLSAKKALAEFHQAASKQCESVNKTMLALRRECDGFTVLSSGAAEENPLLPTLTARTERLCSALADVLSDRRHAAPDEAVTLYLNLRHFLSMYEQMEDRYTVYGDYRENGHFFVRLQCMDASAKLAECIERGRSAICYSATLLPISYYKEQLGGKPDDYAVYSPSPFDPARRLVMVARDVNTRYKNRTSSEYIKIADYIRTMVSAKKGNYIAFFPSYRFVSEVAALFADFDGELLVQTVGMTEAEREQYLSAFETPHDSSLLGLFVMGGIFSEGIDLRNDSLIGAVIVGPGLPMVCNERELFRSYYEERSGQGFDYAYLYPGMNKVLQAAGRVIRTVDDAGCILLLDDRFGTTAYRSLFPREWTPVHTVTRETLPAKLKEFWDTYRPEDIPQAGMDI